MKRQKVFEGFCFREQSKTTVERTEYTTYREASKRPSQVTNHQQRSFILQKATEQSKTGIFRDNAVAEAPPGFQAGWSDCMYFFSLFLFILFAHLGAWINKLIFCLIVIKLSLYERGGGVKEKLI
jgi:hypothetical protein